MILDARDGLTPERLLGHQVCIVGGGPAGISVALTLARRGKTVILIESGGRTETEAARDLNRGFARPPESHEPLDENRRRQWGGTSTAWGGRCIPLDEVDLVARSWVPWSGWPLSHAELEPFFERALTLCEAGGMEFDARLALPDSPELLPGLDGDGVVTFPIERWSRPTNFARKYEDKLMSSGRVIVVLNATCTRIQLTGDGQSVEHLVITTPTGASQPCIAERYVIAAGGLENPRLLLDSDDVAPSGIGNHSDVVGRYYQTHLSGCASQMELTGATPRAHVGFDRDAQGVYCRRRIWITPDRQAEDRLMNIVFMPVRPPTGATGHRSALFSAVFLAKTLAGAVRDPRNAPARLAADRASLASHARTFVRHFPQAIPELWRALIGRYASSRRLPELLPSDGQRLYHLQFQSEQVPNPVSRLTLGQSRDGLGMRRIVVEARMTDQDIDSVVRAHRVLDERLRAADLGHLVYSESELKVYLEEISHRVNSAAHFLGTTRMSEDPSSGVVDANCRVHGVSNLYVAGGSVFPTSGHANPTLTIVALALRLGDHLTRGLQAPG